MQPEVYFIGQLIIILLSFGLLSIIVFGLRFALGRLQVREDQRRKLIRFTVAGLVIWLLILGVGSAMGFFGVYDVFPPRVFFAFIPPLLVAVVLLFSSSFTAILRVLPMSWLFYVQSFRILMELFLWMGYRGGYVPPQLTFEWLNYDIIVGVTAPLAGMVFFRHGRYQRFEGIYWNVFGLALLLNVVIIAVLSAPTPWRVFMNEPANTFVASLPFIWIPGFIVPFALAMHLFSLKQLFITRGARREFNLRRRKGMEG